MPEFPDHTNFPFLPAAGETGGKHTSESMETFFLRNLEVQLERFLDICCIIQNISFSTASEFLASRFSQITHTSQNFPEKKNEEIFEKNQMIFSGSGFAMTFPCKNHANIFFVPDGSDMLPNWYKNPGVAGKSRLSLFANELSDLFLKTFSLFYEKSEDIPILGMPTDISFFGATKKYFAGRVIHLETLCRRLIFSGNPRVAALSLTRFDGSPGTVWLLTGVENPETLWHFTEAVSPSAASSGNFLKPVRGLEVISLMAVEENAIFENLVLEKTISEQKNITGEEITVFSDDSVVNESSINESVIDDSVMNDSETDDSAAPSPFSSTETPDKNCEKISGAASENAPPQNPETSPDSPPEPSPEARIPALETLFSLYELSAGGISEENAGTAEESLRNFQEIFILPETPEIAPINTEEMRHVEEDFLFPLPPEKFRQAFSDFLAPRKETFFSKNGHFRTLRLPSVFLEVYRRRRMGTLRNRFQQAHPRITRPWQKSAFSLLPGQDFSEKNQSGITYGGYWIFTAADLLESFSSLNREHHAAEAEAVPQGMSPEMVLQKIPVAIRVSPGRKTLPLDAILALKKGDILDFPHENASQVEIFAADRKIALGVPMVSQDYAAVEITEWLVASDQWSDSESQPPTTDH